MATPWDEYLKKRKASEESVGNDGATSWEDYKKKRGLTFASANTNSGTGGEQQQPGIQIPKPKGFATPMLRTASATQREAQALNLPQRKYIPHEMNPINPKNSRDMTGKSNVVTGVQMLQYAQQTQKQDPTSQAVLGERDLKQKSVANSPTGVPPRSAAKTETQPLVGMANTVLSVQQSAADQRSLMSEMQQFQHGQPMNAEQITAYGDRATALKRDADYSLAWLEKNKSRISEQEYTSLKNHYTAQKQNADYSLSIVDWYKEGRSAKGFSEIPSIQQSFVEGTADFEGIGARADELHAEIYSLEEKRQDYQRTIQNLSYEDEPAIIAERQRIQAQLDAVNQQLEAKRSELQVERDRLSLLNTYTKGYQEQDPQAADKVAKGKAAYETANAEMDAQYKNDYRVTGVQQNEKSFDDLNSLNYFLEYDWPILQTEGGSDLAIAYDPITKTYRTNYTITNQRFLNEGAMAQYEARQAHPTAISLDHMNDKQKDTYYYLLGAGYDAMAISYANECARATKNRKSQNVAGLLEDDPTQIIPATVAYSLLFPFAVYDIMAGSNYLETGLNVNTNLGPAGYRDAIVSGASNWMNSVSGTFGEGVPVVGGKGLGDVYSTVLSGAESYGAAMAFGQFATIPLALSAASSTYNNAVARGIPEEDAKLEGLAAGGAEALFEYVSIGEFVGGKTSGSIIKDILKQGAAEGSEEVLTGIANHVTDGLINKDNSQFNQNIDRLMAEEKLSYDEARDRAYKQLTSDLIFEGLVGFATGSTMSSVKTVGLYRSADSVIAARGNTEASVADRIRAEQAYVAAGVEAGDSATQVRAKIAQWIQDGANMTLEDQAKGLENYTEAKAKESSTQRDDSAQEANPDSTVIQSEGTQAYLDLGLDLSTAEKAGAVLDGIVKGEITAENMTSNQARALQLNTQIGVDAVRKVLGVEIKQRANSVANGGVMAKAVVQQYEQNKAVATPVSQSQQTAQTMPGTAERQNVEAVQAQEMPQTAQPVQQPAAEQPRPIPRADAVANTDELSYKDLTAATSSVPTMSAEEITSVETTAAQQQRAKVPDWDTFRRNYVAQNKGASYNDAVAAYQDVLQGNQSGETRQSTKTGTVGLERNEYSDQLDKAVTDAVDSLGKLFGLRIRFADLGARNDNGYYTIGTNDVVLDIAPSRKGIAKENAFRFVIAHEIGHAAKDRLGAERWQQFEDYAVKIMGGEKAITAKQKEGAAYADESAAREDVACDFIGQLLSDKATLDSFCDAIRSGEVQKETARGFMAAVRKILGKLRGKGIKQFDAVTKQLAEKAAKQFNTELETAENAVKAMQQVLSEAARAEKNTTQEGNEKSGNEKLNIDNAEKSSYNGSKNKNGGDQYDGNRVDRGVAEGVSRRQVSDRTEASERYGENGRGNQKLPRKHLSQSLYKAFKESGVVATELYDYSEDSAAYSYALDAARNADKDNGWCVTPQSAEDLAGKKLRMDANGSIGYVLADGDIEGVFKNPKTNTTRRALSGVIPQALSEGGTKLDCYGDGLVAVYEAYGFIPVARVEFNPEYANPGWDESKGRPFIYMMMHNGDSADTVVRNIGQYDHLSMDQLQSLPTYDKDGYDEAAAYRDSLLESSKKRLSKKSSPETTAYSERYGSELQTEGQVERAQARAEQRAAEVKQMNEAAAVVEETKAMVSEALETAEKPKTSERANPLLKPKDTGRADFVEMPKTQLDKEVSKISEEQKEAKEQSKAAPLLKNGKPAANVKPKVNAESVQTAVVDIVQQHGAKTDTASVAEKASELTDAFREAAEIAEDINAESAATYLWDKVDSVAEQVFVEGTLHNSETGKTERYDHTYNHQERKSIVDSIKAKMIEAFAQATSSTKTQKQIDRIVQRMNSQVEKALKAAEAKRVRDLAKQAERAEYKAAQQKSQSKESAAKKIDAIRNRYDAKISDLEQKLKALAKEQRKGSKALETEKRKGAAALSKAERRAEQKAERDRKRIEADYQRQLDRLRKAKDAEIKALTQEVALQVFRRGQAGREAEAALRAWRRDAGIDERIISEEDIKTAIKTAEDLAREAEAKNRKPLGAKAASLVKGAYKAFVSDTFELEQFSRKQSREDNLGTMITAYRNRAGIVDAILDRHLVDPDGNVIDNRSLADVLLVTKNGKPDADAQALLGEYSFHKHGVDRMSIEKRAAENMQRFLKQHPEYDSRHGLVATGTLDRATSITEKDGRVRKKSPAQLRPISYKEILTRAMNGDTVAQEYIALAKAFSEAKDKPLMGTKDGRSINAATHQAILDNMEASNPWLAQKHAEVMAWWDKFMRAWSVGPFGTLTQYEALMKMYPNYVPTFRVLEKKSGGLRSKNSIDVDSPFQKATGSHLDLRSMEENFAAQVANVVRQARQNDMWHNVRMETIVGDSDISDYARYPGFHNGSAIDYYSFFEDETAPEDQDLKVGNFVEEKGYVKWYGYSNGVREYIEISKDMYDGLLSLMNATKADSVEFLQKATKVGRALSAPLRATATDYSPVFPITNLIKDFQSAIIYGGFGMVPHEFAAAARMLGYEFGDILNIAKKIALKKSSDAENTKFVRFVDAVNAKLQENSRWQTFLDLGGKYSTRSSNEFNLAERRGSFRHSTEYKLGSKPKRAAMIAKQGVGKVASALGALGEFTESVTRFAAFNRYLDKHGDSAESRKAAMKEAAEITVDFSRHGSVGKYLNAITPYLNASIQSIDKFFREVATRKGAERWHLLKRGAIMGTVPTLILMLAVIGLMDDDEEEVYRNLNQRTRDAYYSIPLEDGTAFTIPKERQYAQLLGNVIERVVLWATDGDENSQLKDYFSEYLDTSIETNFVPNIPIWDSPIIGTFIDIGRNEDFAGRAIVPAKFNGAAPKDQYDETTSAFAIWMGKTFGVSPMVVDYWITDNFASYGDTFVALTNEAENDGNIWDLFLGSYIQAFSADTAYSSRISEQYYNMRNGLSEKKEGERLHLPEDEYENSFTLEVYRAIEKFNDDITDINDLIKETEDEDEKRALKFAAQKIMEEALDFYERCMNGEIEDPVLYLTYEPYGDAIRDELTRLDEYNGEDYDYTFVPNPVAPKIGDHKNTDEEKAAYVDIYNRHYAEQVGSVMASLEYQNADDEQKLNYLEEARELAYYYSKQEFAQEFGIESETYDPDDATHVYDDLMDAGFTFFEAYEVEQKYKEIRDSDAYKTADLKASAYKKWTETQTGWTKAQRDAAFAAHARSFTSIQVGDTEKYDVLTDTYNLSPDKAESVLLALSGKGYSDSQRNSKIVSMSGLTNKERYSVLMSYYDSENDASRRKKIEAAQNAGISAQTYVKVWQGMSALESDKDKNGETIRLSLKNKRAEYLRNATGLTDAQKNLIWQEYYNSENERPDGWRYRYS